ncbi:MAG: 50S ribosomal protein L1 [Candidatus Woesearchaeota archaeon]
MEKKQFIEAIQALKALPKRKFKQTYDFIINLKQLDLKKPEEQVELWVKLPFEKGKPTKIGALVGPELQEQAKANCELVIMHDNFPQYAANKKEIKKISRQYDYFIAQANIMPDVAKTFGRVFGPRGKMPNPKAGCVVPPNANLKVLTENLRKTIKVSAKLQPSIKVMVGKEDMPDEQIAENMMAVYSNVLHKLPQEKNNIKTVMLKLSMSQPVTITEEGIKMPKVEKPAEKKKEAPKEKKEEAERSNKAKKAKKADDAPGEAAE